MFTTGFPPINNPMATTKTRFACVLTLFAGVLMLLYPAIGAAEPPKGPDAGGFIIKSEEARPGGPELWKSQAFDGLFIGMTSADLKKDGSRELFLLSKRKIIIAKESADRLDVIKVIKAVPGTDNVAITSLGGAVYVSAVFNNRPYSSVIEFKDNDYRITIKGIGWLMRTVDVPGSGPVLVGQKFRESDGFFGELRVLGREGSAIVDKGPFMELPRHLDIYRFNVLKYNSDKDILTLNDRDYLREYAKTGDGSWENTWGSDDYFGGTLNYINFFEDNPNVEKEPVPVEGRFSWIGKDKDGKTELIVKRNIPTALGRYMETPAFDRGMLVGLAWDGQNYIEKWKTREIKGYVSDFMIEDEGGQRKITMLVVEGIKAITGGSPKSYVLSYKSPI